MNNLVKNINANAMEILANIGKTVKDKSKGLCSPRSDIKGL